MALLEPLAKERRIRKEAEKEGAGKNGVFGRAGGGRILSWEKSPWHISKK